jgi:hypothetical protein
MCNALSDERSCLLFTIAAGPRQDSHTLPRIRETHDNILVFQIRDPQPVGPRIYIPQEQGGSVIPRGTGFPFRRHLLLARLRWRYSNPSPRGD